MYSLRSFVPVGLIALALGGVAGCKKDEPAKPDPAKAATSSTARNKLNVRNPMGPMAKIDPQTMKDYRLDVCYYGTLSLRQARDSYLASLGKDEPSDKKIPNFGVPAAPSAGAPPSASGAASAAPKAPAPKPATAASGAPQASGAPAGSAAPAAPERKPDFLMRAPHERNARACTAAVALKEPAMGDVDAAVGAFAPFAVELAKDITTTNQYYQREEYKKDGFGKGKELDKKLRESFAKLDELHDKVGAAITAWRKDHPADASKREEGEKMARDTVDAARDLFLMVAYKKVEPEAYKAALDKLDKSVEAMKAYSAAHAGDPWAKIMAAPFEAFMKTARDSKVTADKTFEAEAYLTLVSNFTGLVEARQRAISRTMMAKPTVPTAPAASGAASGEPAPAQPPQ